MPRKSLPVEMKRLRSFAVVLHVDTEEGIYTKLCELLDEVESKVDHKRRLQNSMIYSILRENPYADCSWRETFPKRLDFFNWMGNNVDEWSAFEVKFCNLNHDFDLCIQTFNWYETKNEDASDMLSRIQKCEVNMKDEFEMYERDAYQKAKKLWEVRDAEWIADEKLKNTHKNKHKSFADNKKFYDFELAQNNKLGLQSLNEKLFNSFPNGPVDTRDYENCKYCVEDRNDEERKKKKDEHLLKCEKKHQDELKRQNEEFEKQRKVELKEKDPLVCKICTFCTYSDDLFDVHLESKEHAKRELLEKYHCKTCEFHGRNATEYMNHTLSKKHRTAMGDLKSDTDDPKEHKEHKCLTCEYSTYNKQNFEKHCTTKSHMEKVK